MAVRLLHYRTDGSSDYRSDPDEKISALGYRRCIMSDCVNILINCLILLHKNIYEYGSRRVLK